jgi:hypothetical protein
MLAERRPDIVPKRAVKKIATNLLSCCDHVETRAAITED